MKLVTVNSLIVIKVRIQILNKILCIKHKPNTKKARWIIIKNQVNITNNKSIAIKERTRKDKCMYLLHFKLTYFKLTY